MNVLQLDVLTSACCIQQLTAGLFIYLPKVGLKLRNILKLFFFLIPNVVFNKISQYIFAVFFFAKR